MPLLTVDKILAAELKINALSKKVYVDKRDQSELITDGVVSPEDYIRARKRIMWILKEPYCDGKNGGGGWSLVEMFREKRMDELSSRTLRSIIYATYGIQKQIWAYDDIPWIRDMKENVFKGIAFINAKKLPGVTFGANGSSVIEWFRAGTEVINQQIAAYDPEIIIACGPHAPELMTWHGVQNNDIKHMGSADYGFAQNRIFIHAYHPGYPSIKQAKYVNDILSVVKLFES